MTALHVDQDVSRILKDLQAVQKRTGLTEEQIALKYFNDQGVFDRLRRDTTTIRKLRILAEGLQSIAPARPKPKERREHHEQG